MAGVGVSTTLRPNYTTSIQMHNFLVFTGLVSLMIILKHSLSCRLRIDRCILATGCEIACSLIRMVVFLYLLGDSSASHVCFVVLALPVVHRTIVRILFRDRLASNIDLS